MLTEQCSLLHTTFTNVFVYIPFLMNNRKTKSIGICRIIRKHLKLLLFSIAKKYFDCVR